MRTHLLSETNRPVFGHKAFALVAAVLLTGACGSDSGTLSPNADRLVAGVNLSELALPPSPSALAEVAALWQGQDVSSKAVREEAVGRISGSGSTLDVRVLSHVVGGHRHVGAITVPRASTAPLPVLIYAHFGDDGVSVESAMLLIPLVIGARLDEYVLAIPSFRSQTLTFEGIGYKSEGEPSPWVGEVDDGLAFLNTVLETTPQADAERIIVFGMSAGGANAMLMAIRDSRIDGVIDFFGPTDFFAPFVMDLVEDALTGEPPIDLPGIQFLGAELVPRLQSGELSAAHMRLELLQRSPLYFVDRLPPVQIHHGSADDIVPAAQSQRLSDALVASGNDGEFFEYEGSGHSPLGFAGSQGRAQMFLGRFAGKTLASR